MKQVYIYKRLCAVGQVEVTKLAQLNSYLRILVQGLLTHVCIQ